MNYQRISFCLAVMAVLAMTLFVLPAEASDPFTLGGSTIENAKSTSGGTFPLASGEMSVRWVNTAGGDTQYDDTSVTTQTTVDTGYDIVNFVDAQQSDSWTFAIASGAATQVNSGDSTQTANVSPGDTVVHAFQVHNVSNNPAPIPFKVNHFLGDTGGLGLSNDTFTVELFEAPGAVETADQFDASTATRIPGSDSAALNFTHGEVKTVYAVITVGSNASNGETQASRFFVSNQVDQSRGDGVLAGDQWEDGQSISTADNNDTQAFVLTTSVAGPILDISKTFASAAPQNTFRPGDTVDFTITVTNTGGDTAQNVVISDAVPDSTTYTVGSATAGNTLNGNTLSSTTFFNSADADEEGAGSGETSATRKVVWEIDAIGPTGKGNSTVDITFSVTID